VNEDDDQRADDLERVLDEGDLARATKMAKKWSTANAQVALAEVQRRSDAHRRELEADDASTGGSSIGLTPFTRRDDELASLRAALED
jgi:hypothetical protein